MSAVIGDARAVPTETALALRPRPARLLAIVMGATAIAAIIGAWYLTRGAPNIAFGDVLRAIGDATLADTDTGAYVVRELRVPRLLIALACGAALGLAGTIMQDALRNPIADPGLIGVSQAATLAVAVLLFFPGALPGVATPALALAAGLVSGGILVLLARSIRDPVRLVLVGVVLSMLFGTATTAVVYLAPQDATVGLSRFFTFTTGSVVSSSWERLDAVWPWLILAVPLAFLGGRALNLLQLGDDVASGLGMQVTRARFLLFVVALLLVAPVVSICGPIAFVALLSPHVARFLLRSVNAYVVLPASAAVGAVVVLIADTAGRLLFFPLEIPAGIWTIVVAGPLAIWLAGSVLRASRADASAP